MSEFWESELGAITGTTEDAFAKSFTQIPDGTTATAKIEAFVNAEYNDNKYLNIEWLLTDGAFKGQKVQQKLKVFDVDPKTRHRSLNMLKLIYNMFHVKPKHSGPPSDHDLGIFHGNIAGIKIRETEPNDKGKQYNWVSEIHESKGFKCETGIGLPVKAKTPESLYSPAVDSAFSRNRAATEELNDDIPF
jgi:hypothetical protein